MFGSWNLLWFPVQAGHNPVDTLHNRHRLSTDKPKGYSSKTWIVTVISRINLFYLITLLCTAVLAYFYPPLKDPSAYAKSEYALPAPDKSSPFFEQQFLNPAGQPPSVHAGSLTQLANGDLLAAWFGGSREGAADVAIYTARYDAKVKEWSIPVAVTDRQRTSRELGRYVRKLGNPVIYADQQGRVWLFYVTVSIGGWAGSSITIKVSENGGRRWSQASRLVTSPFLNISTLVKGSPIALENGALLLPVYHEFANKFAEVLHLDPEGQLRATYHMTRRPQAIQPWIVPDSASRARAFYRRAGDAPPRVLTNESLVSGNHWNHLEATDAPNPGAAVAVIRAFDGSYLMAYNPLEGNRNRLALARSTDGLHWKQIRELESGGPGDEFSYPYLIRGREGRYHLIYTWQRKRMRHVVFNQAWLEAES
jgi:predicted neuraminidase